MWLRFFRETHSWCPRLDSYRCSSPTLSAISRSSASLLLLRRSKAYVCCCPQISSLYKLVVHRSHRAHQNIISSFWGERERKTKGRLLNLIERTNSFSVVACEKKCDYLGCKCVVLTLFSFRVRHEHLTKNYRELFLRTLVSASFVLFFFLEVSLLVLLLVNGFFHTVLVKHLFYTRKLRSALFSRFPINAFLSEYEGERRRRNRRRILSVRRQIEIWNQQRVRSWRRWKRVWDFFLDVVRVRISRRSMSSRNERLWRRRQRLW